jgi:hypothetical protein
MPAWSSTACAVLTRNRIEMPGRSSQRSRRILVRRSEVRASRERARACDVEVVLLRRAEAVQENDGGRVAVPTDRGDRQAHAANTQVHLLVLS